jgi:hypothetical protein
MDSGTTGRMDDGMDSGEASFHPNVRSHCPSGFRGSFILPLLYVIWHQPWYGIKSEEKTTRRKEKTLFYYYYINVKHLNSLLWSVSSRTHLCSGTRKARSICCLKNLLENLYQASMILSAFLVQDLKIHIFVFNYIFVVHLKSCVSAKGRKISWRFQQHNF